jgi:hypothetical protein
MSDLKKFQDKIGSQLDLSENDLNDFLIASDHDKKCKCDLCKKWHLIMKGKYKSSDLKDES